MFAVIVAVVGGEDDEGVVEQPLFFQFRQHATARGVHFGGEAVIVLHHHLIFLRRVEPPTPAIAPFVLFRDEPGQPSPRCLGGVGRHGDLDFLVKLQALRLRQKLQRIVVLGVRGEECEREAKRFVLGSRAQKLQRIVLVLLRDVNLRAV